MTPKEWRERKLDELQGRVAFAGLDLSSTLDTTALALVFPGKPAAVLPWFWVPENACRERERRNRTRFDTWIREGWMTQTEGDVVDYEYVRRELVELNERFHIAEVAVDRWNATQISTQLMGDGFEVVLFGQGFQDMSAPTKHFHKLILSKGIEHGGNPVLRWMAGNVAIDEDAAGNMKPSKKKSTEKIDGIVATIMGIGRWLARGEVECGSVYEQKGNLSL